jgi:hypothetical protein
MSSGMSIFKRFFSAEVCHLKEQYFNNISEEKYATLTAIFPVFYLHLNVPPERASFIKILAEVCHLKEQYFNNISEGRYATPYGNFSSVLSPFKYATRKSSI